MKTLVLLMIALAFCTQCTGGSPPSKADGVQQTNAKETPPPSNTTVAQEQNEKNLTAPGESEALKVYIDPETGEFITPSERKDPAREKLAPPAATSTSSEGLEERPAPGGGIMLDLEGRFRTPLTATTDSNGKSKIEHQAPDK